MSKPNEFAEDIINQWIETWGHYPTGDCPGEGYFWNWRSQRWERPSTPAEYEKWLTEILWGKDYKKDEHKPIVSQEQLDKILAGAKPPPKNFQWH